METVTRRRNQREVRAKDRAAASSTDWPGIVAFGLLICATPLAFGGVDRLVQIALLVVFGLALALRPAQVLQLDRVTRAGVLILVGLLLVKEFAPAGWFGTTKWRTVISDGLGVTLPWTHHPEPGRAVDALLMGGVATLWFLWVRTLASTRGNRRAMAWIVALTSAVVAIVSFATHGIDPKAIYGLRLTPGWTGFGPFPNRNHTASFLAMGALIACGCVAWSVWKKRPAAAVSGSILMAVSLAGLLLSQSRGGLVAFAAGLLVFAGLILARLQDRRAYALAAGGLLILVSIALTLGAPVLSRFTSETGAGSTMQRAQIWADALTIWKDAPLFGHGAGSFASVYPLYQTVDVGELTVLHPESSWLQWLAEFGLLPMAVALGLALIWAMRAIPRAFAQRSGFFLFAGAISAAVALLAHSAIDVPSHRWGTAALGLAALALALPAARDRLYAPRQIGLLPLAIAAFWALPLLYDYPAWSPLSADRVVARSVTGTVSIEDLERSLQLFPLNPKLHQLMGAQRLIMEGSASPHWKQHFSIANRLRPTSSAVPAMQAQLCGQFAPQYAISYWQEAIERAGDRRFEILSRALQATIRREGAADAWGSYTAARPELLLTFAGYLEGEGAKGAFMEWWSEQAFQPQLHEGELEMFYRLASRWLTGEEFVQWSRAHPERSATDFRTWARLLQGWKQDQAAWELLARHLPEPQFPPKAPSATAAQMERIWSESPDDVVNAQALAQVLLAEGDAAGSARVILESARRTKSPVWFRNKAAHLLAARGEFGEAVALVLGPLENGVPRP